jgi:hypothetical protein
MMLWLFVYSFIPFLVFLFTAISFIKAKRRNELTPRLKAALPIAVFALLLVMQASVRSDVEHFIPTWIFSLLTLFVVFDFKKSKKIYSAFVFIIIIAFISFPVADKTTIINKIYDKGNYTKITTIPRAERFIISKNWYKDLSPAVKYIRKNTNRNEKIFVCNNDNDKSYIIDVMFYFLAERLPGTRYHELHPGISTTKSVQEEIIRDLKKNNVQYIVLFKSYFYSDEPNLSSKSSGVKLLDNYIRNNYSPAVRYGNYQIMKHN